MATRFLHSSARLVPLALLAATLSAPAPASRAAPHQPGPPVPFVWQEGENATRTTFNRHSWYANDNVKKDLLSPGEPGSRPGEWLAHYNGDARPAEAEYSFTIAQPGNYNLWVRASAFTVRMSYRLDGGPATSIDTEADRREYLRLLNPNAIDIRFLAWLKAGPVELGAGPHRLVFVLEGHPARQNGREVHGGIDAWCLAMAGWEPTGALRPDQIPANPGAADWFPLLPADDPFSPESITDLTPLLDKPAGKHGPAHRDGEGPALAFKDGTPVKFWGVNASIGASDAVREQQARYYAKNGINLVRVHPVEGVVGLLEPNPAGGVRLNPDRLDRLDHWFATMKAHGIYVDFSPFYPHVITPADGYPADLYAELPDAQGGKSTSGFVNYVPELQAAEWAWLRVLLAHVNPYTGLSYAADPALAIVEVHNEDSIFWHYPLNPLESGRDGNRAIPRHQALLQKMWAEWLREHYANDAALLAAWGPSGQGSRPGDGLQNERMAIYGAWEMAADGPSRNKAEKRRMGSFIHFLADTQRRYFERRAAQMREAGFGGVVVSTAWQAGGPAAALANTWTDDAADMIDRHRYAGGHAVQGASPHRVAAGAVRSESHLTEPGSGILGAGLEQVEDKPFMLSEWTQSPPNEWKAEIAPLVAFYGFGLQGWDASTHFHASLPRMGGGWPDDLDSYVSETPHYIGQFPALARAIYRGDIAEGVLVAARRLRLSDAVSGVDAISQRTENGGWNGVSPGDLLTPARTLALGRVTQKISVPSSPIPRSERQGWDVATLQSAAAIATSSGGELVWDVARRTVTVRSPRTQAVIGFAGGRRFDLPGLSIDVTTPFVSLIVTSLDDRPILESSHMLITALARDKQTGTRYSADGKELLEVGGPPLLLEPVQARMAFNGAPITSARVVDIHGVPQDREVERRGNTIAIDGRYQTYYYEVKRPVDGAPTPTVAAMPSPVATATAAPSATASMTPQPTRTPPNESTPTAVSTAIGTPRATRTPEPLYVPVARRE